jgi:hypothetical protein
MKLQRTFIYMAGIFFAAGLAVSQAVAGEHVPVCDFEIEVNALRAGSPTAPLSGTKDVTAKARIAKGTAPAGTVIETQLTIAVTTGGVITSTKTAPEMIRLGVGKGGQGAKLQMQVPDSCVNGVVGFIATFVGKDIDGDECVGTRRLSRTCN